MKKTVHLILGAFLRSLWIGALLVVVVLGTCVLGMCKVWPEENINPIIWGEMAVAVFFWFAGLLHDLTA